MVTNNLSYSTRVVTSVVICIGVLGPRQRQNIEPRSYTKSAPKEVQNKVEKSSKVKSSRQLINSIPTIQRFIFLSKAIWNFKS